MLGADVLVAELHRFTKRKLQGLLGAIREWDVTPDMALFRGAASLDQDEDFGQVNLEACKRLSRDAISLDQHAKQNVFSPDHLVVQLPRLFLGEYDDAARTIGEGFKHCANSSCATLTDSRGERAPNRRSASTARATLRGLASLSDPQVSTVVMTGSAKSTTSPEREVL